MSRKGFSIAETLISVLLMGFAGLLAAAGIMLATRTYLKASLENKAQAVLEEYQTYVTDVLRFNTGFDDQDSYGRAVFYHHKYKKKGVFKVENNAIVFKSVTFKQDDGCYVETDEDALLIVSPKLMKESADEIYTAGITCNWDYSDLRYQVTISIRSQAGDFTKTAEFSVIPATLIIE